MKKVFTFLPGRSNGTDRNSADNFGSASKRREQLRKAQRTHRQRKHQYFKSLEAEVLRLRANEVNLLARVQTLNDHVNLLQRTLEQHGLSEVAALTEKSETINGGVPDSAMNKEPIQCSGQLSNGVNSRDLADMDIELTDPSTHPTRQDRLDQVISDALPKSHAELIRPTNIQKLDQLSGPLVVASQLKERQYRCTGLICNQDMTDMGMEFVMALEDPCRPHMELHLDKPNGHALLTSATLIAPHHHQHPLLTASKHTQQSQTEQNPATIFENLLALSGQLVVEDELSPIQAWYYILQQTWASKLDPGKLRKLSSSLLKLIECHGFGAVMQKNAFENILLQNLSRTGLN
ncbi:uncharacterized protein N7484_010407 [Penicillium longicatenatum]|uniref:uncharacterized protein n=1 Tax=Penicillium longicatenatum TaxID=1561947 RepID=UPI002549697A|nr:uncharacterized protein N7484_010407 [Penicillium longicatenatum]KAJ5630307.1 hypothetical protein N7484_010407 [Penicillium longicatenatum]